jgi:hypothetical protein
MNRSTGSTTTRALQAIVALLFLNAMLAFDNWWPTPAIRPDHRLSTEFVWCWVLLLAIVRARGALSRKALAAFSAAYLLLVIGRYFDVTVPALFGGSVSLYWHGQQGVRFLWVSAQQQPWWFTVAMYGGAALLLVALYSVLRAALRVVARDAAPYALRSRAALALTGAAVVLSLANHAGVRATWPIVSRPVTPTYWQQAELLLTALSPTRLQQVLPPSPAFDSDLGALGGIDVKLLFIESYGAVAFDRPEAQRALAAGRAELARAIETSGRQVVSAFVRSPTFGGASDLAHLGLLSGLDLSDPRRHDLLLTTRRPTLLSLFRSRGYQTFGLYPALSWEWPERSFYGFDVFIDGRDLGYRGPRLGYWWIPDQYSIARLEQLHPLRGDSPPRLLFFPTITSHLPFSPVPPYQPDWTRLLSDHPFDDAEVTRALAEKPDWLNMLPGYLGMIDYEYRWLAGYLRQPGDRDYVMVLVGDHQPVSGVSGEGVPWDVPVHIIASKPELLRRFVAMGFTPGLEPQRPTLGPMYELTRMLLRAFSTHGEP